MTEEHLLDEGAAEGDDEGEHESAEALREVAEGAVTKRARGGQSVVRQVLGDHGQGEQAEESGDLADGASAQVGEVREEHAPGDRKREDQESHVDAVLDEQEVFRSHRHQGAQELRGVQCPAGDCEDRDARPLGSRWASGAPRS